MSDTKIWEQQEGESAKNYSRFLVYRNSPERNIISLTEHFGVGKSVLYQISAEYKWQERAQAYDIWLGEQVSEVKETQIVLRQTDYLDFQRSIESDASVDGALWMDVWRKTMQRMLQNLDTSDPDKVVDPDALLKMAKGRLTIDDMMRRAAGLPLSIKTKEVEEKDPTDKVFYITDE